MQSQDNKQVPHINDVARQLWYADPNNKGATMKTSDRDKMVAQILKQIEENKAPVQIDEVDEDQEEEPFEEPQVEEEEEEEEDEGVTLKRPVIQKVAQRQIEDEEEEEGVTIRLPPKRAAPQVQTATAKIEESKKEDEEEEEEGVTLKATPKQAQPAQTAPAKDEEEEEEDDGATIKQPIKVTTKPEVPQVPVQNLQLPAQMKISKTGLTKVKAIVPDKKETSTVRKAEDLNDIALPKNEDEHDLFIYKDKRILHSQIWFDYKDEEEYKNNKALLVKRACQKQTIIFTDKSTFEAQDTEEKVEFFLRENSSYFKDVVRISVLAKGGEAIVYTLEHSLPDELVIKCPILSDEQQENLLNVAFNGILYESQCINLNPHQGHVVNNVEEIILYNEKLGIITNYCVIVEKAKYTLQDVVTNWAGVKFDKEKGENDEEWIHRNQDYYTPEKLTFYFLQTLMATAYFHKRNIFYGDMKGANLLIFRNQEVKIGDLGISIKMKSPSLPDAEKETYIPKGISEGFCLKQVKDAWNSGVGVTRDVLINNDRFAIQVTFDKSITTIKKLPECAEDIKKSPYFMQILQDVKKKDLSLYEVVQKWAVKLDSDIKFKNKLCTALKREYKFLGLPKIHLMLDQKLMANFYMKKQIVYKKEVGEDNIKDPGSDFFVVHETGRADKFPYSKPIQDVKPVEDENQEKAVQKDKKEIKLTPEQQQQIKEKIDLFWSLKAAKSTRDEIRAENDRILEVDFRLTKKRINARMHDFKDFEIKLAKENKEQSINNIKLLDAITGPNNEGFQIELQHKLCFEIAKALDNFNLAEYFLKRVEQIFILEFGETDKESSFKEQHIKMLRESINANYEAYKGEGVTRIHEIQFAFYSYFKYKESNQQLVQTIGNYEKQIGFLVQSMDIFKNLMGENIELQNKMIHRKAIAHMLIGERIAKIIKGEDKEIKWAELSEDFKRGYIEKQRTNYAQGFADFKRLYLTTKTLQSYHDYIISYKKMIETTLVQIKGYRHYDQEEIEELLRFKYDEPSGFLLFKEFFNSYYQYVKNYGIKNPKVIKRLEYLKDTLNEYQKKSPKQFDSLFKSFLRQINDNSFEDVSKLRTHLRSYNTYEPKNSYLKLRFGQFDMEKIDLGQSILSDDIEFLLNYQDHKITLKKLIFHFDINKQVVCIDSEFWDSQKQEDFKTNHFKETKQTEVILDIPPFVYPIAIDIIDDSKVEQKKASKKEDQQQVKQEDREKLDEEARQAAKATQKWVMVQLSNFSVYKIWYDHADQLNIFEEKAPSNEEKGFGGRQDVQKTMILFNRLTKPFNDYILGTFSFFNQVTSDLRIQNYFFKMSKRQYIISLMRYSFAKLQIVHHPDQIDFNRKESLIVYRDKYLFSSELFENEKIKNDLLEGKKSFNWLFSQEKLLNQRKKNFKQYMKDVRNHLIYHIRQFFLDGEDDPRLKEQQQNDITKMQEQMGKTIDVLKCFEDAVAKMFDGIKHRYQFKIQEDKVDANQEGAERKGKITVGYTMIDKRATLKEISQPSVFEQKIYMYHLIVFLRFIQRNGYNVKTINDVQVGQDFFTVEVSYTQDHLKRDDHGQHLKVTLPLKRVEFIELLEKYLDDKTSEYSKELLDIFRSDQDGDAGQILPIWQREIAEELRANLTEVIKKEKIFPHLMRILPLKQHADNFQSELYSYLAKEDGDIDFAYSDQDKILLQLMFLKSQYKTKTPSSTIRDLKYRNKDKFDVQVLKQMFTELQANEEQSQLFNFFKEQLFRYYVFDTTTELLNEWKEHLAPLFAEEKEDKEIYNFANLFFYASYDYYSINVDVIIRQMREFFSVLNPNEIVACIAKISQIVLARIQGSLNENKPKYVEFLRQYYAGKEEEFAKIEEKINEYVVQEYDDQDYKNYETEFNDYNKCGEEIKTLKEEMPITHKSESRSSQDQELEALYQNKVQSALVLVEKLIKKVQVASLLQKKKNILIVAYTHNINKKAIKDVNEQIIGNLLLKKIILKASRTKHRIFNQHRILKKYLQSLEESVVRLQEEHIIGKQVHHKKDKKDLLTRLYDVMNKNVIVTLQEQYDHEYLPKFKEVFNRLDEYHRFTDFDDFEIIVKEIAARNLNDPENTEQDVDKSEYLENRYIDIEKYPYIKQLKFFIDEHSTVHHISAQYNLDGHKIRGHKFEGKDLGDLNQIPVDIGDGEVIHDISAPLSKEAPKLQDFVITLGKDYQTTKTVTFDGQYKIISTPVSEPQRSRRVISFSGLLTAKGLLNFNLYFYNCVVAPEEKHLFIEEDSDSDDFFKDDQEEAQESAQQKAKDSVQEEA